MQSQLFSFYRDKITHNEKCLDAAGQGTKHSAGSQMITKFKGKQSEKCLGTKSIIVRKGNPVVLVDSDFSRALEFTIR